VTINPEDKSVTSQLSYSSGSPFADYPLFPSPDSTSVYFTFFESGQKVCKWILGTDYVEYKSTINYSYLILPVIGGGVFLGIERSGNEGMSFFMGDMDTDAALWGWEIL
jgi:hypothetical protein